MLISALIKHSNHEFVLEITQRNNQITKGVFLVVINLFLSVSGRQRHLGKLFLNFYLESLCFGLILLLIVRDRREIPDIIRLI